MCACVQLFTSILLMLYVCMVCVYVCMALRIAAAGDPQLSSDIVEEMRLLRVRAAELELALKKKSRESEKMEKALKNQVRV